MSTVDNDSSPNPLDRLLGLRVTSSGPERVEATMPIGEEHKQAHGIVHGGVYCTIIEAVASIGANVRAGEEHAVVGLCNRTNFVRAVRDGTLRGFGVPVFDESGQQTWEASIFDEDDRLVATGVVTLLQLDPPPDQRPSGTASLQSSGS
ncbi:PaaI family thioesterase [Bounagaea algeriensis]